MREVGREPLAQPHIVPVLLGDGVAEPLVGHFVHDRRMSARDVLLAVEDRRGRLHASADARRLDVRELFVRVRPDLVAEELEGPAPGELEERVTLVAVLRKHPHLLRDSADDVVVMDGEPRDAEREQPRRDGDGLLPMRAPQPAGQVHFLSQQTVGHHLIVRRRRDDELPGRLVVGMVDRREPLACAVRPALAEDRALAVNVLDQAQSLRGDAAVLDRHRDLGARPGAGESAMRRRSDRCVNSTGFPPMVTAETAMPFPPVSGREVEKRLGDARRELQRRGCLARDLVAGVAERQAEHIVDGVDARLSRVSIGRGRGGRERDGKVRKQLARTRNRKPDMRVTDPASWRSCWIDGPASAAPPSRPHRRAAVSRRRRCRP